MISIKQTSEIERKSHRQGNVREITKASLSKVDFLVFFRTLPNPRELVGSVPTCQLRSLRPGSSESTLGMGISINVLNS